MAYRLRTDAGLTQEELAQRMGTTQSAIARMEGGGARPTLETLEKLVSLSAVNSSLGSVRTFQATAASPSSFATAMR
jgi:transcriptional regulator with XRE-family HTH domain